MSRLITEAVLQVVVPLVSDGFKNDIDILFQNAMIPISKSRNWFILGGDNSAVTW